jgi:hypothetical protein
LANIDSIRGHLPIRAAGSHDHLVLLSHIDLVWKAPRFEAQTGVRLIRNAAAS